MRLAIATENGQVSAHFGHCQVFTIVDIENGAAQSRKELPCPPHQTGFLPNFLKEQGAQCIVAGGMGGRAQQMFASIGIEVISGVMGPIDEVIEAYIAGNLRSGENLCSPGTFGEGHGHGHGSGGGGCGHHH